MSTPKDFRTSTAELHQRMESTEAAIGLLLKHLSIQHDLDIATAFESAREEVAATIQRAPQSAADYLSRVIYVLDGIEEKANIDE